MGAILRAYARLLVNKDNTVSVTGKAKGMAGGFDANPSMFLNPDPTSAALLAQVAMVDKAESVAATRVKGSAAARNVERGTLASMLETGRLYIQNTADKRPSYADAVKVILAGALTVGLTPKRNKPMLAAKPGAVPNSVDLDANVKLLTGGSKKKASFNWQMTTDGKTFTTLPSTPRGRTTVQNLTPLTTVGFRVCITNSSGIMEAWSQVVEILVH